MKFLKQTAYIRHVIAKLSKFEKISMHSTPDFFLQKIEITKGLELVPRPYFS